jgi:muramoyltetrapeptide carboxypeptidase
MDVIKPAGLRRGDAIGVVVPAGPLDRERIDRALARLAERGFRTKTYGDIYRTDGYLAGNDATRARELMDAFADPETTAVWCARGGYGVARIIDKIDFEEMVRRNPKVFVGFSDISILHIAIVQQTGLCTFHAPNLQDGFGEIDDMLPSTESALWHAVMARAALENDTPYILQNEGLQSLSPGIASGRLTGGNLAVICGLMGTPYEIETRGRVLFLEDIDERPYRIDRYLAQLSLAGKLQSATAVMLGDFTFGERKPEETDGRIADLFAHYLGGLGIPVLLGIPSGHIRENLALPINALVEIDANRGIVTVCECIVKQTRD